MAKKKRKRRKGRGPRKGSAFERRMSVMLSRWWTDGRRDDIFWRASGSGNRATVRAKRRKTTVNSHGDIAAIDPKGEPLLDLVSISLKNGYFKTHAMGLLDKPNQEQDYMLEEWIREAKAHHENSGSYGWIIIHQRTKRSTVVYLDHKLNLALRLSSKIVSAALWPMIYYADRSGNHFDVVRLDTFLRKVSPEHIKELVKRV